MARNAQKSFLKHVFYEFLPVDSCMPIWMEIKLPNDPGVLQNPKTLYLFPFQLTYLLRDFQDSFRVFFYSLWLFEGFWTVAITVSYAFLQTIINTINQPC